jgi:hypothetical protein
MYISEKYIGVRDTMIYWEGETEIIGFESFQAALIYPPG